MAGPASPTGGERPISWAAVGRGLGYLGRLVRWKDWSRSKLPFYLACMAYAVLRMEAPGAAPLGDIAGLLALLSAFAAYGHLANDFSDREVDRLVGKHRPLAAWSEPAARAAVATLAAVTIVLALALFEAATVALTIAAVVVATLYSLPPARLKERPLLSWASATLAQRTLPVAIVFQALDGWDATAVALTVLSTLVGLRFIIVHQLFDRWNDRRASVSTAATAWPLERLRAFYMMALLPAEIACAVVAAVAMGIHEPMVAVLSAAYPLALWLAWRRGFPVSAATYAFLYELYCILWPVALCGLLAFRDPVYIPVLGLALALVADPIRQRVRWVGNPDDGGGMRAPNSDDLPEEVAATAPVAGASPSNPSGRPPQSRREDVVSKANPYPLFERWRARGAVHRVQWPGIGLTTVVVRHQEALTVLRDPRFIKDRDKLLGPEGSTRPRQSSGHGFGPDLIEIDPPDHTRVRKFIGRAFTSRMVAQLEGRVQRLADDLVDEAKARGEMELVADYAATIPITIITRLLGVPIRNLDAFRRFAYALTLSGYRGRVDPELQARKDQFARHLEALFVERRRAPRDDLVSALVQAEQDGDRLSTDELVSMVYLLLLAGFVTTVNLIGTGVLTLLRHPEQLDLLRRNPDLGETAIEELLRFESPLELTTVSYAAEDLVLGGETFTRGAAIRVVLPSVNRDERVFQDPGRLDISRSPNPHLSFGQGIHYCVGAPLARLEGRIAIRTLVERLPALRIADPAAVEWMAHPHLRGLQRMPLRF